MTSRKRIRVLFALESFEIGGSEMNAVRTAERLDRDHFDLAAACLHEDGPLKARYDAAGIPVTSFALPNLYGTRAIREGRRFARLVRDGRFDIVHTHDVYMNMFAIPWGCGGSARLIACRRWWTEVPRSGHRLVNRLSYRLADRVLANSPSIASLLEQHEHVPAEKIAVIPNFVDEDAFTPPDETQCAALRSRFGVHSSDTVIGCVANLLPIKDHALLLEAASMLVRQWPGLRVVLVGDGECRSDLERRTRELGITNNVVFAGRLTHQPSPHFVFDISVLTSRGEGFPNSVVEAMAAGRAVVATSVGGVPDAITNGETGLLVPAGDAASLARALEQLIVNPARRRELGDAAQRSARERFHAREVLHSLESLYERLVA